MKKLLICTVSMMIVGTVSCSDNKRTIPAVEIDGRTVLPGGVILPMPGEKLDLSSPELKAISEKGKAEFERLRNEEQQRKRLESEKRYNEFMKERRYTWAIWGVNSEINEVKEEIEKCNCFTEAEIEEKCIDKTHKLAQLKSKLESLQKKKEMLIKKRKEIVDSRKTAASEDKK